MTKTLTENQLELLNEEFKNAIGCAFPSKWLLEKKFEETLGFEESSITFEFDNNEEYGDWGDAYYWDTDFKDEDGREIILKVILDQAHHDDWNYTRRVKEIEFE